MTKLRKTLILLNLNLLSVFTFTLSAQNDIECGTKFTEGARQFYEEHKDEIKRYESEFLNQSDFSRLAIISVPVKAHIVRTSNGVGGLSESALNAAMANVNNYYANANLEFFLCDGINYIDSDNYYDYETDDEAAMTGTHNVSGLINIYFTDSVTSSSSGNGLCGYAYFPGGPDTILMANSCTTNGSTLPHEIGHFFSLLHTHGSSNSDLTEELVDGSNCTTTGDFLCDTPADPQLSYSNVTSGCVYVGSDIDANGQVFNPDETNIMSYSRKECRTYFSPQQYARMFATYQVSRNIYFCPSFNADFTSNFNRDCSTELEVNFVDQSVGATSWQWDINSDDIIDYTEQNPTHTFSPGVYDVTLTISNGSETNTIVIFGAVDFDSQSMDTSQVRLVLNTDDWSQETSWEFKDSNDAVLYSDGPYNGTTDDFQTFEYLFDVDNNECYSFTINDSYGDGICCFSGFGSYTLSTFENDVIVSGGEIGFGETTFMSNETLSLNDFQLNEITIYPNPVVDGLISIKTNYVLNNTSYKIQNILGQTIGEGELTNNKVQLGTIIPGTYFLSLESDNAKTVKKFIVK